MTATRPLPANRIEAFSDGVIAIIITVMVFDLKVPGPSAPDAMWADLAALLPRFLFYAMSFLILAIMWINHHQLFHQVRHVDGRLLWYSIALLFWMSLIPFGTNLLGTDPMRWQASFLYGLILFMCALSFTLLRHHVVQRGLLHERISTRAHVRIRNKNILALAIYLAAAGASLVSVYISFALFLAVPVMYVIPERIAHQDE